MLNTDYTVSPHSTLGSVLGIEHCSQQDFLSFTRRTFQTDAFLKTCLLSGSTLADSHEVMSLRTSHPRYHLDHTTDVLAHGLRHLRRSSTLPMEVVPNPPFFSLTQKPTDVRQGEPLRFAFAGMCFNVTALLVVRVGQVLRAISALSFTLITLSRGARTAKPFWKICKPFARYATLVNPTCIWANKSSGPPRRPLNSDVGRNDKH